MIGWRYNSVAKQPTNFDQELCPKIHCQAEQMLLFQFWKNHSILYLATLCKGHIQGQVAEEYKFRVISCTLCRGRNPRNLSIVSTRSPYQNSKWVTNLNIQWPIGRIFKREARGTMPKISLHHPVFHISSDYSTPPEDCPATLWAEARRLCDPL